MKVDGCSIHAAQDEDKGGKSVDDQGNTDQGGRGRNAQELSYIFGYGGEKSKVDRRTQADQEKKGCPPFTEAYLLFKAEDSSLNFLVPLLRAWYILARSQLMILFLFSP